MHASGSEHLLHTHKAVDCEYNNSGANFYKYKRIAYRHPIERQKAQLASIDDDEACSTGTSVHCGFQMIMEGALEGGARQVMRLAPAV